MSKERYGIIYKITNTVNGKCYIGQTTNDFNGRYVFSGEGIERVYKHHKYYKEHNRHYNVHLLGAIEKYGPEVFDVIEEFDVASSKEELDSLEKKYIKEFDCIKNGYNHKDGGSNGKYSEEVRRKMSESHKGKYCGENHYLYGKHRTEEEKRKMSESHKGKNCGENHPMYGVHRYGKNSPNARKVICLNDSKIFNTVKECAEYYNKKDIKTIRRVCKHEQERTRDGLVFMYYDEYIQQQNKEEIA